MALKSILESHDGDVQHQPCSLLVWDCSAGPQQTDLAVFLRRWLGRSSCPEQSLLCTGLKTPSRMAAGSREQPGPSGDATNDDEEGMMAACPKEVPSIQRGMPTLGTAGELQEGQCRSWHCMQMLARQAPSICAIQVYKQQEI